jgi:hypothetical protein
LINFSFSQNSDISLFISKSKTFFEQQIISDFPPKIPYSPDSLYTIYKNLETSTKEEQIYAKFFLFKFALKMDSDFAFDILIDAYNQIQLSASSPEFMFIRGYYHIASKNFSSWKKFMNYFSDYPNNPKLGKKLVCANILDENKFFTIILNEQIKILEKKPGNYPRAEKLASKLLKKYPKSDKILHKFIKFTFFTKNYKRSISLLQRSLNFKLSDGKLSLRKFYIAKLYFLIGEANISQQYILNSALTDTIQNEQNYHLLSAKINYLTNTQSEKTDNWLKKIASKKSQKNLKKFKKILPILRKAELFLNKQNHLEAEKILEKVDINNFSEKNNIFTMSLIAKLLWKKKDFFNSKRYLHNILNRYDEIDENVQSFVNLLLADISYKLNDFDQFESYFEEIKLEKLEIYDKLLYSNLKNFYEKL